MAADAPTPDPIPRPRSVAGLGPLLYSPLVRGLLGLIVVGAAFVWALPSFASYAEVWSQLGRIEPTLGLALAAVGAANLVAPSTAQRAALPGLTLPVAVAVDWVTSAVTNTVPRGERGRRRADLVHVPNEGARIGPHRPLSGGDRSVGPVREAVGAAAGRGVACRPNNRSGRG